MYLTNILLLVLSILSFSQTAYVDEGRQVHNLPFLALYRDTRSVHIVQDKFVLTQHINFGSIIKHIISVKDSFVEIQLLRNKTQVLTNVPRGSDAGSRLALILEHTANRILGGVQFLPHNPKCNFRAKRNIHLNFTTTLNRSRRNFDFEVREEPVVSTWSLFP